MDNPGVAQLENFRLKVFRTVAEHLSFRKAAEQLFLTQPAVTLQIKALEDDLRVRVFDRTACAFFCVLPALPCCTTSRKQSVLRASSTSAIG